MWRAFFLGIGASLCILGLECLVLEKAVLARALIEQPPTTAAEVDPYGFELQEEPSAVVTRKPELKPGEASPWVFISAGSVVMLYAAALRRVSIG